MIKSFSFEDTPSDRLLYADGIRAYAAVSVVVIHVAADLVEWFPCLTRSWWWIANVIDTFAGPAVPLFYMLSGMLLLDPAKKEPIRTFLMKRARRVLLPWLAWGIIYLCWRASFRGEVMSLGCRCTFVCGGIHLFRFRVFLWPVRPVSGNTHIAGLCPQRFSKRSHLLPWRMVPPRSTCWLGHFIPRTGSWCEGHNGRSIRWVLRRGSRTARGHPEQEAAVVYATAHCWTYRYYVCGYVLPDVTEGEA